MSWGVLRWFASRCGLWVSDQCCGHDLGAHILNLTSDAKNPHDTPELRTFPTNSSKRFPETKTIMPSQNHSKKTTSRNSYFGIWKKVCISKNWFYLPGDSNKSTLSNPLLLLLLLLLILNNMGNIHHFNCKQKKNFHINEKKFCADHS